MKQCSICKRDFPPHLVQELEMGDERGALMKIEACPLCAYAAINAAHGAPLLTPPPRTAPKARKLFIEARAYVRRQAK